MAGFVNLDVSVERELLCKFMPVDWLARSQTFLIWPVSYQDANDVLVALHVNLVLKVF